MVENIQVEITPYDGELSQSSDDSASEQSDNLLEPVQGPPSKKPRLKTKETPVKQQQKQIFCSLCHASFGRQDHLKRHMECLHSNYHLLRCPECKTQCTSTKELKGHVKEFHDKAKPIFKCRLCSKKLTSFTEFSNHESSHLSNRHKCPECTTVFKRRDHMLRHIKSKHLNQRVLCPQCGVEFKRRDHLVRHAMDKHRMVIPVKADVSCDGT